MRVSDPWLSFGPDGTLYLATLPLEPGTAAGPQSTPAVSVSRDGGLQWSDPVLLDAQDQVYNDKESITADPHGPGTAYVAYSRRFSAGGSVSYFSRSDDFGATWSFPRATYPSPSSSVDMGHVILVPHADVLVDVFARWQFAIGDDEIMAMRSEDGGQTWSPPASIATTSFQSPRGLDGGDVRALILPSAAVNTRGDLFVTWHDISARSRILVSTSRDEGQTWSEPKAIVKQRAQAFMPTLATYGKAGVGVYFYDFRRDVSGDSELTTDIWFMHSHDGGDTWKKRHMVGPFDMRTAMSAGGHFVGDYMGLATAGRTFYAAFGMSIPQARGGRNDIFFGALEPP